MATAMQIKKIHTLMNALNIDDELYREILKEMYSVETSKNLTIETAAHFIETYEEVAVRAGVWQKKTPVKKEQRRNDFATYKQQRLIAALWKQVSRAEDDDARNSALRKFIKRIAGVDSMRFLPKSDVEKVVKALEKMGADYER